MSVPGIERGGGGQFGRWLLTAVLLALVSPIAVADAPGRWWDAAWPCRVRIRCADGPGDVAWVRVTLAGRTTADGHDLRLVDDDGQLRSFELLHHDAQLETLIRFQVSPEQPLQTWLYYGNPDAARINLRNPRFADWEQTWQAWNTQQGQREETLTQRRTLERRLERLREQLAAGGAARNAARLESLIKGCEQELAALVIPADAPAPTAPKAWDPERGVLLRVYRKARRTHPETLNELRRLARGGELEGACFCAGISDGFNRFGPSEHYISIYEGYLQIDQPGTYAFCTVSDDGSWLRVNSRPVVSWPGAHGIEGTEHGEKNGEIKLGAGVARVDYYHEEGLGGQVAFVGWRPPGQEGFSGIPDTAWLGVRRARAHGYQSRTRPIVAVPHVRMLNTYWIRDSADRQASLGELRDLSGSRAGEIVATRWDFGDGLSAAGRKVRHVYFRTGRPEVTLTVTDDAGNTDSVRCAPHVFYVDVKARYFRYGNARQYADAAAGYDVERMAPEDLRLYAEFWGHLENWAELVRAAEALLRRFPDTPEIGDLVTRAAHGCMQPEAYDPARANELYILAIQAAEVPADLADLELRRAHVLAWGLGAYAEARRLLEDTLARAAAATGEPAQAPRRRARIGLGDVALLEGDYDQAEQTYRAAQGTASDPVEQARLLAKRGSYGYTVTDLLARDEFEWALKALDRWEREFPVQKLEGYTFFLRGKVLYVQQPGPQALQYLGLAERVAPGAIHVPEAVWLRANCLLDLGQYAEALAQFQRIRRDFTESGFFEQAAEKIARCQAELVRGESSGAGG